MKENLNFLVEWAVWGHLKNLTEPELLVMRGHLSLEKIMELVLTRSGLENHEKYTFYQKILLLNEITFQNELNKDFIVSALKKINSLRNKTAHEFEFNINNGQFDKWSQSIFQNLQGTKYSKYTNRTKLAHSFSILAINILNLTEPGVA